MDHLEYLDIPLMLSIFYETWSLLYAVLLHVILYWCFIDDTTIVPIFLGEERALYIYKRRPIVE